MENKNQGKQIDQPSIAWKMAVKMEHATIALSLDRM